MAIPRKEFLDDINGLTIASLSDSVFPSFALSEPSYRRLPPDNPLQEFLADSTLLSTSAPHPAVASIVEPNLNELVHRIGIHAKQTSSLDPAGLKYSAFFLLILSPFPPSNLSSYQLVFLHLIWNLHITLERRLRTLPMASLFEYCRLNTSIIIIKSNGLSADPWCNPTSMLKYCFGCLIISWMMFVYAVCSFGAYLNYY